jgi:hypothetical protein
MENTQKIKLAVGYSLEKGQTDHVVWLVNKENKINKSITLDTLISIATKKRFLIDWKDLEEIFDGKYKNFGDYLIQKTTETRDMIMEIQLQSIEDTAERCEIRERKNMNVKERLEREMK